MSLQNILQPFVLSTAGRQWIFGGELSRVEGRSIRPYWALLFSDLLLFATVSRDRVLFVTEEPVALATVSEAQFNVRKKGNLLVNFHQQAINIHLIFFDRNLVS